MWVASPEIWIYAWLGHALEIGLRVHYLSQQIHNPPGPAYQNFCPRSSCRFCCSEQDFYYYLQDKYANSGCKSFPTSSGLSFHFSCLFLVESSSILLLVGRQAPSWVILICVPWARHGIVIFPDDYWNRLLDLLLIRLVLKSGLA